MPKVNEPVYLNIVWDRKIPGIKGDFIKAVDLGAPDRRKFRDNLLKFFRDDKNAQYCRNIRNCMPNQYKYLEQDIQEIVQRFIGAHGNFEDCLIGIRNIFTNVEEIIKYPDISQANGTNLKHCIIVGAGPSFDLELENLKKIHDLGNCLIISCDSSIKRLLNNGIRPHIVVTAERTIGTERYFMGLKKEDVEGITLVASMVTYPPTLAAWPGHKAFFFRRQREILWYPEKGRRIIATAPQVMQACFGVACIHGCTNIALVGSDLAFHPDTGKSHAELDAIDNKHEISEEDRQHTYWAPGTTREKVLTMAIWDIFAEDLRSYGKEYGVIPINTSKYGRKIDGIPFQSLDSWMKTLNGERIQFSIPKKNPNKNKELKRLKKQLPEMLSQVQNSSVKVGNFKQQTNQLQHYNRLVSGLLLRDYIFYLTNCYAFPSKIKHHQQVFEDAARDAKKKITGLLKANIKKLEKI
jgi:hypothetical protein